jgi:hypothetical protein
LGTGSRSAALTIVDNASPPTQSVPLTGSGLPVAPVRDSFVAQELPR